MFGKIKVSAPAKDLDSNKNHPDLYVVFVTKTNNTLHNTDMLVLEGEHLILH